MENSLENAMRVVTISVLRDGVERCAPSVISEKDKCTLQVLILTESGYKSFANSLPFLDKKYIIEISSYGSI